jgi:uncharacterized protein YjbI with pentapeptide repeats
MQKPGWLSKSWLNKHKRSIAGRTALVAVAFGIIALLYHLLYQWNGSGFGPGSTKTTERNVAGQITKTIEVEQSGKTLWDWLSLLGVPAALAGLGIVFQQREQKRSNQQAELEKEIAAANQREEALQAYFDRLSTLLIDKNLIAVAAKVQKASETRGGQPNPAIDEQKELLSAAVDIIRARTLAILRQFGEDGERKASVLHFLIEAEVIRKLKLNLSSADLSDVNLDATLNTNNFGGRTRLSGVNLSHAHLSRAHLSRVLLNGADLSFADLSYTDLNHAQIGFADLNHADLSDADLSSASLNHANLSHANLSSASLSSASLGGANLTSADLRGTNLKGANLNEADLSRVKNWTEEQLSSAKLRQTRLPEGCDLDPDRDCQELESRVKGDR